MDERRRLLSDSGTPERVDLDEAPKGVSGQPAFSAVEQSGGGQMQSPPAEPFRESYAFYGDGQQVRVGFAIALRAMGVEADFLGQRPTSPPANPNREDS